MIGKFYMERPSGDVYVVDEVAKPKYTGIFLKERYIVVW